MFVAIKKSKTSKRELVYIVESYRDENQKIKQRIIKKCGELSELLAEDPDAIEKLKEHAKKMSLDSASKEVELAINMNLPNSKAKKALNYGYFFLEAIYDSLRIDSFIEKNIPDPVFAKTVTQSLRHFVYSEFFLPLSEKDMGRSEVPLFGAPSSASKFKLKNLEPLIPLQEELQNHVCKVLSKGKPPKEKVASMEITSYRFNSTSRRPMITGLGQKTPNKLIMVHHGLLMDKERNPIGFVLFPEGKNDTPDLIRKIEAMKKSHGFNKIVITSDTGYGSNSSLQSIYESGNGYVVGRNIGNVSAEIQNRILDDEGYRWNDSGTFKYKSFVANREIGDCVIPEKIISMWTSYSAAKALQRREKDIVDFLAHPNKYDLDNYPEMKRYISVMNGSGGSGAGNQLFSFDSEAFSKNTMLDGYIAIATTEIDVPDAVIVRRYHSLSKIGKAFAAPESDISSNVTEYWTYKGVQEYFLVAWLAYLLERRLEILLDGKYPIADIKRAMRQAACTNIGQDVFSINVQSDIFKEIEAKFGVSFDKAYATLEMIRKFHKEIVYKP
ncbi:MAG: hypothetical protein K6G78_05175 [bacterium]|nr:hypothetical protein [bacterium]